MSQTDTVRYAELISAVAVFVSLVFVGFEIRQSNYLADSEAVSNLNRSFTELNLVVAANAELSAILIASRDRDLSETESLRLNFYSLGWFNVWDSAWLSHERGIVDYDSFISYMNSACSMIPRWPNMHAVWDRNKVTFTRGFVVYIESNCPLSQ